MLARGETHGLQLLFEVALWGVPALLAWLLLWRAPRGARAGWFAVAGVCTVISIDKWIDLQTRAMPLARGLGHWLDPEAGSGGADRGVRIAIVFGAAALVAAGLWLVVRLDGRVDGPKRLAAAGLSGVVGYLAVRQLLPPDALGEVMAWSIELGCWGMVLAGLAWGLRRSDGNAA